MNKLTPAEAYEKYVALKLHFTTDSYDVNKYDWKTRNPHYETRKDKIHFEKLARHPDPIGLMVSNFVHDPRLWIGQIFDPKHQSVYTEWKRRRESLTYLFQQEIKQLDDQSFKAADGQHPPLLRLFLSKKLSPETMVILDDYVHYQAAWNKTMVDDVIWQDVSRRITKYRPFVHYDAMKIRPIMREQFIHS
jgi:T4 gene Gp59 loader of gp41 DNA helicase